MKKIILPFSILFIGITTLSQNPLLLKDVYPGIAGSGIQQIVKNSNYTFFNAGDDDANTDRGQHLTDRTPGGNIKFNLTYPAYLSTKVENLPALGNKVIFAGDNFTNYGDILVIEIPDINCDELIAIPDANFEQALIALGFDTNGLTGNIKKCEAAAITDLSINNKNISSLSGIEHFVGLISLHCASNLLTTLNLGSKPNLAYLNCDRNALTSIDVSNCPNLISVNSWNNQLTTLDVSQNLNLEELIIFSNKITSLDISLNTKLKFMNFAYNKLVNLNIANGNNVNFADPGWAGYSFDARNNPALSCIKVDANMINNIPSHWFKDASASYNTNCAIINCNDLVAIPDANFEQALIDLGFDTNGLTGNIKKCEAASITDLNVNNKNISSLSGIEHFAGLRILHCNSNLLTSLNLGIKPNLTHLNCAQNAITSIDLSNCPNLVALNSWNNQLTTLDVSQNLNLEELISFSNKITSLDISLNTKLKFMNFANNKLVNLNIANGNNINFSGPAWAGYSFDARNNPALSCIKVDAGMINNIPSHWFKDATANYSMYSCESLPVVYVNNNSQTGDVYTTAVGNNSNSGTAVLPFATIQYAINRVAAGGVIYVDAGTYATPDIILNKAVTIFGPNALISPNDAVDPLQPNASRNAESIITGSTFTIGSGDITIEGLSFDPGSKTQILQAVTTNDFDNLTLSKNIFRINSGATVLNITGRQVNPLVTFNYLVADNRFIKEVATPGTTINIRGIDNVQVLNNTFTVSTDIANRTQTAMNFGTFRMDNLLVRYNTSYRQRALVQNINSKKARLDFNKAIECNRFILAFTALPDPCEIAIADNIVIDDKSTGGPVISYARSFGSDLSSPNIARIERNTITLNATGLTTIAQALIAPNLDNNSPNTQVYIRDNMLKISGDFSAQTSTDFYVSGIRFLGNSRQAVVENNDIEFTGVNYGSVNKFGIGVLHSGLLPDAIFNFNGNKFSGFPTSIGIQQSETGFPGFLPTGVTMNINNNSFTGDFMSINNGTNSQTINASCNWYGSAAAQNFINKLSLSTLDIMPWLTNGIDNNAATGFQPVGGSCDGYATFINLDGYTDVTCNGANNGTINITATYGKAPTVFTWTKDGDPGFISHDEDPTNLSPGTYHLALVDGNGSNIYVTDPEADGPGTIDVTITEPSILTATATGTNNLCFGQSNGTASVLAGGGTAPYSYLWNNGETTEDLSNLVAGIYSVTVTDANGCTANAQYEVTQPTQLNAVATGFSTSCVNSASVAATGGTGNYSYLWSNGATTQSITSISAGSYSVTVTDENGCTVVANTTVTGNQAFNPSVSATDVSCFGGSNGILTVTNANGVAPFTYSLNGINFQSSNVFDGLIAKVYTVTVKDALGCTGFNTKTISQPPLLTVVLNTVQSTCFGLSTGSISVTVAGGSGALSYSWSGPNGFLSTAKNISNLAAGNYSLTVTDANGCVAVLPAAVPTFNEINVNAVVTNVLCKGAGNGSIDLTVSGGTGSGFSYLWNNLATTEDRTNLGKGTNYRVDITDIGSGCIVTRTYSITEPADALGLAIPAQKIINVTGCFTLGSFEAVGSGGTPFPGNDPYLYSIDGVNYQPSKIFNNLPAASYTVRVKDANGCIVAKNVVIGDTGSDEYEKVNGNTNNNNKNRAVQISIATSFSARIGTATDEDWFKFTTSASGGNYILSISNPPPACSFLILPGTGVATPILISSTATTKEYALLANKLYYIQVTGGLSLICYQLSVSLFVPPITSGSVPVHEVNQQNHVKGIFDVKVFGNPSPTGFVLKVETNNNESIKLRVLDILGRVVETRQSLQPDQMIRIGEMFRAGVYIAEITQGDKRKTIKLIKQ